MADIPKIEEILEEIEALEGVSEAILVSRSGMYIAGKLPTNVHPETYASMFAVLLGAADTASAELKETLSSVVVNLEDSRLVAMPNGPKAIYVLRVSKRVKVQGLKDSLASFSTRLQEHL